MRKRINTEQISRGFTVVRTTVLRVFEFAGREIRYYGNDVLRNLKRAWRGFHVGTRASMFALLFIMIASIASESLLYLTQVDAGSRVSQEAETLLVEQQPGISSLIQYKEDNQAFLFNEGYKIGAGNTGFGGSPQFSASFPLDGNETHSVTDPVSGSSIGVKPLFDLGTATRDENRLLYDLRGKDGIKVVTVTGVGYKEDIVLNSFNGDSYTLEYELQIPDGVEARLEADGSIGFYGVQNELLGNVAASSPEDQELLQQARQNGEKNNLLFSMPAPYVVEYRQSNSVVEASFELEGNMLRTVVSNMKEAQYPISIDPSVYVETARKFMRGNNETNTDFDVTNELIQKASTTGARFDAWGNTTDLNAGRFDGGTTAAGGYIYQVGGVSGTATENSTAFTSGTGNIFNIPTGVTSLTVELWGGGGGGGAGGSAGLGGSGGGGGYATATLVLADLGITDANDLLVDVGGGGGGGTYPGTSGGGGGGGGHSEVRLSGGAGTIYTIAPGGGGGGGGDNSSGGAVPGGDGGAGGDESDGIDGSASSNAGGGQGATSSAGGAGGTGGNNNGGAGSSETGGPGANGSGADGGANNGGTNNGDGDGGTGNTGGFAAGGGGGSGYYGGGGGSASASGDNGGGGGGGGTGYADSNATATTFNNGSGTTPGNDGDADRSGAADGGAGGAVTSAGSAGDSGRVVIKYYTSITNTVEDSVYWANINDTNGTITSPNPGAGACTNWCTDTAYNLPDERRGLSLVSYNGFMYAIGGEDSTGTKQSTVYIAKIGANGEPSLWHPTDSNKANWVYWYADTTLPEAVSYTSVVAYNNRMYLLGGSTTAAAGGVTTVRYTEIEPTGELASWTTTGVAAMSTARFMHTAEVYNDNLYVVGGDSSATGALLNTVEYIKLADDGTFAGTWETTSNFATARRTNGGDFTTIHGAYLYLNGGCTAVSGGDCQTVGSDVQIASIYADGSISEWVEVTGITTARVGYGFHSWQNHVYRVGGCTLLVTTSNECVLALDTVDYATIYPPGEASTVSTSQPSATAPCSGGNPQTCDLPSASVGNMLNGSVILNGYLYIMGGCTNNACTTYSTGVTYQAINSDGTLERPASCTGTYTDSYCVSSSSLPASVGAPGMTTFNGRIYVVGGFPNVNTIYYTGVNSDGSLTGWTNNGSGTTSADNVSYTFAYARANPSSAGTNPGNLFIFGGCSTDQGGSIAGIGCSGYSEEVWKCNIGTTGAVSGCTTTGQTQIGTVSGANNTGLGAFAGAVYANYIYLMGGLAPGITDLTTVYIASFDDSNNVVESDGAGTANWTLNTNEIQDGRRRGSGFGYNGYLYITGGYDGTLALADIEFAKVNVSDGTVGAWGDSSVSIDRRWGLTAPVSNSFAYVIGGCTVGSAPSGCTTRTNSIQTFQVYNNDSGTLEDITESTGNFANTNDRIGSSSAVLDGYIYVAGGENSSAETTNVQVAQLNPNGSIGTWSSTTASLPAARAYGQLEVAGGDLYYVGGEITENTGTTQVYYASPTTGSGTSDVVRTTTYKLAAGEFTGTSYTLTLDANLQSDYFVMIAGSESGAGGGGPDSSQARVDGDPFGNLVATTSADQIRLQRGLGTNDWVGSITVVECVSSCTTDGFQLSEVLDVSLANNNTSTDTTLASAHTSNTVPFGGYLGGGLSTSEASTANFSGTAGVRIRKNSTNQIRIERQDNGTAANAGNASAADVTVYIVEWGSNWNAEELNVDNWDAGGQGVNATGEYTEQTLGSTYTRANTWVWKSPGNSEDNGLGDGAFGKVVTLGDGVNQNATENSIALGSEPTGDNRDDTVYVMEHTDLAVDYQFNVRSNKGTSFTDTVDAAIEPESVNTVGNVTSSAGYRIPLFYYTDNGTGTAYTRVAGWDNYFSNDTTISYSKAYSGNNQSGWVQSVDFGNNAGQTGGGDISSWSTATNGLPAGRTSHGAAVWNDRIYVVGGLDAAGSETSTVYISPQLSSGGNITSAWTTASNSPDVARSGGALIAYANNLYYLGGNDGTNYLSDVQFASIGYKTGTISQSGTTVTGSGTTFTSAMVGSTIQNIDDGSISTITGFTSATSITVDTNKTITAGTSYLIDDGSVGNWTFSTSLPQYVSDADGFAANGFMYLFGGRSATSTCTNNTYVSPISANTTIASGNNPTGVGEWYQTNIEFAGDRYAAGVAYNEGTVYISGGGCGTELTANQHYYGTLRSQPQLARYSYYVDADTDVFPNAWLLNGLDNNIGARWQFGYRSSTDAANAWGSDTDFGDVTLGRVETYTPKDGTGTNTEFARYFYVTISIDASQTFGYPDDVSRGPTIDDLSIFFVSDPNKRLRHGKTFIQGIEQPLDTPCRVNALQPNCPLN